MKQKLIFKYCITCHRKLKISDFNKLWFGLSAQCKDCEDREKRGYIKSNIF